MDQAIALVLFGLFGSLWAWMEIDDQRRYQKFLKDKAAEEAENERRRQAGEPPLPTSMEWHWA